MEARLEEVSLTLQKILRMVISLTTNRNIACDSNNNAIDFLSIFPLKTEESVDKFEQDLSDGAFRNAAVIVFFNYLDSFVILQVAFYSYAALKVDECLSRIKSIYHFSFVFVCISARASMHHSWHQWNKRWRQNHPFSGIRCHLSINFKSIHMDRKFHQQQNRP